VKDLAALAGRESLVVCDCEGAEKVLLDPFHAPALQTTDLLVELHDFIDPSISSLLLERFHRTHEITLFPMQDRDPSSMPLLAGLTPDQQRFTVWEGRPPGMQWAWMQAKS
jgi:hypothetical protein